MGCFKSQFSCVRIQWCQQFQSSDFRMGRIQSQFSSGHIQKCQQFQSIDFRMGRIQCHFSGPHSVLPAVSINRFQNGRIQVTSLGYIQWCQQFQSSDFKMGRIQVTDLRYTFSIASSLNQTMGPIQVFLLCPHSLVPAVSINRFQNGTYPKSFLWVHILRCQQLQSSDFKMGRIQVTSMDYMLRNALSFRQSWCTQRWQLSSYHSFQMVLI